MSEKRQSSSSSSSSLRRRRSRKRSFRTSKRTSTSSSRWLPKMALTVPSFSLDIGDSKLIKSTLNALAETMHPIATVLDRTPVFIGTCLVMLVVMLSSRLGVFSPGGTGMITNPLIPRPRIIGGSATEKGQFPHAVSIQHVRNGHFCGGSLIKEDMVLTAGHCVLPLKNRPWEYRIVTGTHNLKMREKSTQRFEIVQIIEHPDQSVMGFLEGKNNDVAIIRIHGSAPQSVLTLNSGEVELDTDDECLAVGWGAAQHIPFKPADELKQLSMSIVSMEDCKKAYGMLRIPVDVKNICALPRNQKAWEASLYYGDSGGALLKAKDGKHIGVGVVSMGFPIVKMNGGFPTRFVKIARVHEWIQQQMDHVLEEPLKPIRPGWGYVIGRAIAVPFTVIFMLYGLLAMTTPFIILASLVINRFYGNYVVIQANEWGAPVGIMSVLLLFMFPTLTIIFYFYLLVRRGQPLQALQALQGQGQAQAPVQAQEQVQEQVQQDD